MSHIFIIIYLLPCVAGQLQRAAHLRDVLAGRRGEAAAFQARSGPLRYGRGEWLKLSLGNTSYERASEETYECKGSERSMSRS